ncbi:OB-fold-containig protein [Sandaracinobacteroides hominis]|uniref:OB-fold-containig protein n=1 Tax=Sandaracinobacteroides hominis TaxID=2780086 RepID=UPI0018F5919B|nr:OB-fold-containig protein [Sandaracinobacteroides hominis]
MLSIAFEPSAIPFSVALGVMLLLGLLQAFALGVIELPDDPVDTPLDWLNSGRVPLMVLLILFLTFFGLLGLALQALAARFAGGLLSFWVAGPLAGLAALPVTRWSSGLVGRILPNVETTAMPREALVGLRATITTGTARPGFPAPARVRDQLGGVHQVLVEPEADGEPLVERSEVLLVHRIGEIFRAIPVTPHPFLGSDGDFRR